MQLFSISMEETTSFLTPTLAPFFLFFCSIYLLAFFTLFRNWGPTHRPEATSCFISLFHGTPAIFMAAFAISASSSTFASPNTDSQNMVIEFSTAYFLVDLLHYAFFFPRNSLFILHHVATLYALLSCRYAIRHGASALVGLLILAEVTSPCQNLWHICGLRIKCSPIAAKVFDALSVPFYGYYSVVRGVLGPVFAWKMGLFYLSGEADRTIPRWAWISWMFLTMIIIWVSILWVRDHWVKWFQGKNHLAHKKVA